MSFPFVVTYKKKLTGEIEKFSTEQILEFTKQDFVKSGADSVRLENNEITASNRFFDIRIRPGWNFNRWIGISNAKFQILESGNYRQAIYTFSTTRIFIISAIVGLFFGLISQIYWIGLIGFGAIGLLNWLIKLLQHWICFDGTFTDLIYDSKHKLSDVN